MSIAKCPICGKAPMVYAARNEIFCQVECCDHSIATPIDLVAKWNKYAAAMELAKDFIACDASRGLTPKIVVRVRKAFQ